MATNYGYVRRDPEDRINWADVGTDISNKLKDEIERRDMFIKSGVLERRDGKRRSWRHSY